MKASEEAASVSKAEEGPSDWTDPRRAAKERAKRRSQMTTELFSEESVGIFHDISGAEVQYEVRFSISLLLLRFFFHCFYNLFGY